MVTPIVPDGQEDVARITYRYLRWFMVILPAVLLVVTVWTALQQGKLEQSISAYYGGPVRDVFVGVMIATAVCMVAYRGASLLEDYTLNGAGIYAVFVALVPSTLDEIMGDLTANSTPDSINRADYIWFLRAALTTVLGLSILLALIELRKLDRLTDLWKVSGWSRAFIVITSLVLGAFLVLAMWQLWKPLDPDGVTLNGIDLGRWQPTIHDLAAYLLIAALAVAVLSHAWPRLAAAPKGENVNPTKFVAFLYRLIFLLMVLGVPAIVIFDDYDHITILVEWWEILLFSGFWVLETIRIAKVRSISESAEMPEVAASTADA